MMVAAVDVVPRGKAVPFEVFFFNVNRSYGSLKIKVDAEIQTTFIKIDK
jgi:hypothetical protein